MFKTGSCSFPFLYLHFFPVIKKKKKKERVVLQNSFSLVPFSLKENFENAPKKASDEAKANQNP